MASKLEMGSLRLLMSSTTEKQKRQELCLHFKILTYINNTFSECWKWYGLHLFHLNQLEFMLWVLESLLLSRCNVGKSMSIYCEQHNIFHIQINIHNPARTVLYWQAKVSSLVYTSDP